MKLLHGRSAATSFDREVFRHSGPLKKKEIVKARNANVQPHSHSYKCGSVSVCRSKAGDKRERTVCCRRWKTVNNSVKSQHSEIRLIFLDQTELLVPFYFISINK